MLILARCRVPAPSGRRCLSTSAGARFVRCWQLSAGLRLELHMTDDVVSQPPYGRCDVLINPANEELVGTKLPYFPMPVEPPPELRNTRWCGMEAGERMFYPMQVVDGRVHALGGGAMKEACAQLPLQGGVRCPTGKAVVTPATSELGQFFGAIVHAVPPLYMAPGWSNVLSSCWRTALEAALHCKAGTSTASKDEQVFTVACPLLGAGARGAPVDEAARVAAEVLVAESSSDHIAMSLCLAVREESVAAAVQEEVSRALSDVQD
eukprot:TRINITY_DN55342_c0_g1_i1.p1 TRINITY_DN55342_c0_g1~~TRINITY_DN55342_c0_g1_i1.p1  ORF type:complete len:281 (+),score=48.79 TRINITY_DN55342_c0_g1_i1:49-843(+)